jgi:hypothetical protein
MENADRVSQFKFEAHKTMTRFGAELLSVSLSILLVGAFTGTAPAQDHRQHQGLGQDGVGRMCRHDERRQGH